MLNEDQVRSIAEEKAIEICRSETADRFHDVSAAIAAVHHRVAEMEREHDLSTIGIGRLVEHHFATHRTGLDAEFVALRASVSALAGRVAKAMTMADLRATLEPLTDAVGKRIAALEQKPPK